MGFYSRFVLPQIINLAMKSKEATRHRAQAVPAARGRVLEIGIGSGLNLPFYGGDVETVFGLDPSPELLRMARKRAAKAAFPVELVEQAAEEIPFDAGSFDTLVMTWTLCSIAEPLAALGEMRRVMKPDGALIFVEHGLAPDRRVEAWQHRLNPVWKRLAGGCNLDRRIDALIRDAGFAIAALETGYVKGPKPMTFVYNGVARRE